MTAYDSDWTPKNRNDCLQWKELDNFFNLLAVASSEYTDEEIIRGIAAHDWSSASYSNFLPRLGLNPNLTPDLLIWLDEQTRNWPLVAQNGYWLQRYAIPAVLSMEQTPATFKESFYNTRLDASVAARQLLEIASPLAEQMWHDLALQGIFELSYWRDSYSGDEFVPNISNAGPSVSIGDESVLQRILSKGYFTTWISVSDDVDYSLALENATRDYEILAEESGEASSEEPFTSYGLAYAYAGGLDLGDIDTTNESKLHALLDEVYSDDESCVESSVEITQDTLWLGPRYRALSPEQQENIAHNISATLTHPYLGATGGIATHLLVCLALHSETADLVRDFIVTLPLTEVASALRAIQK